MNIVKDNIQPQTNQTLKGLNDTNFVSYLQQNTINTGNAIDALYKLQSKKQKPRFELAQIDSFHQLLTFHNVASVDNFDAIGTRATKKEAMQSAAYKLLYEIAGLSIDDNNSLNKDFRTPVKSIEEFHSFCGKRGFVPIYEEVSDPNCDEFSITCAVQKYKAFGNGKNKKVAKRSAAKEMLLLLKNGENHDEN